MATKSSGGSCTVTVSPGGLQSAVSGASSGDVVCAEPGTYDGTLTIGVEDLTVRSTEYRGAVIDGPGGTSSAVTIEADDVAFERFEVMNPEGLLGIKVETGYDGATIQRNVVTDVGPTGRLGVTGVIVGQGDHEGIEITNNVIKNLDQETTEDSGFPTVNGILFDAGNDPGTITNVSVNNNTIRDIESDIAPLGIVVQHMTDGVDVNANHIRDLTAADDTDSDPSDGVDFGFTFAQGINVASPSTANMEVNSNVIEDITSSETILPEAVKIDGDGSGLKFRSNQFLVAIGMNNRNGTDGGSRDPSNDPIVDAKNNWWGSQNGPEEADFNQDGDDDMQSDVVGNVDYEPFLRRPPGGSGS